MKCGRTIMWNTPCFIMLSRNVKYNVSSNDQRSTQLFNHLKILVKKLPQNSTNHPNIAPPCWTLVTLLEKQVGHEVLWTLRGSCSGRSLHRKCCNPPTCQQNRGFPVDHAETWGTITINVRKCNVDRALTYSTNHPDIAPRTHL